MSTATQAQPENKPSFEPPFKSTTEGGIPGQQSTGVVYGVPNKDGVIFYQIIDIINEMQRGNFIPIIHCLKYELIPRDFLDGSGYSVLHHAVSIGDIPMLLILLDYFKIDVNLQSANKQTAIMIACNYAKLEIIRILLERGATLGEKDNTGFSALTYSVKEGFVPQMAYLLHHQADLMIRDTNGCTLAHWAAFKNNIFMLKVLGRIGLDLKCLDGTGLTPLDRAVQGESIQVVEYLINNVYTNLPDTVHMDKIENDEIKELLRRRYFPTQLETSIENGIAWFKGRSRMLTFGLYAILWLLGMHLYRIAIMFTGLGYTADLIFFLTGLYFLGFSYFYFLKSHGSAPLGFKYDSLNISTGDGDESLNNTMSTIEPAPRYSFDTLDKLIQGQHAGTIIHEGDSQNAGYASFLHEFAWLFESKNYHAIGKFEERDFCADCLQRRPPRSFHPKNSNTCVANFHHYSHCLGRSVDSSSHVFYLLLLITQSILFTLFLVGIWSSFWPDLKNTKVFFLETGYIVYEKHGILNGLLYWLFLGMAIYNLIFTWIEFYCLAYNLTFHEVFNFTECTYLHKIKQDSRGTVVKSYHNPYDKGIVKNVMSYFKKIVN